MRPVSPTAAPPRTDSPWMGFAPVEGVLRGLGIRPDSAEMQKAIALCGGTEHLPERVPLDRFRELAAPRTRLEQRGPEDLTIEARW